MKKKLFLIWLFFFVGTILNPAQTLTIKNQILNKLITMGKLTQAEVNECGGADKVFSDDDFHEVDLNKDRNPEFIVYSSSCGLFSWYIFRKIGHEFEIIFEAYGEDNIEVLLNYTNGWLNLRWSYYGSGSGESDSTILSWNGREYK